MTNDPQQAADQPKNNQVEAYSPKRTVDGDLSDALLREMIDVERRRLDVERERIDSNNLKTDIMRRVIEANDAADKRQFDF